MPITNPLKTQAEVDAAYTKNMSTINQSTPPQPTAPAPQPVTPAANAPITAPKPTTPKQAPIVPQPPYPPSSKTDSISNIPGTGEGQQGQVWDTTRKQWVAKDQALTAGGKANETGTAPKPATNLQFGDNKGKEILQPGAETAAGTMPPADASALKPSTTPSTTETTAAAKPVAATDVDALFNKLLTGQITASSPEWQMLPYDLRKQAYAKWTNPTVIFDMIKSGAVVPGDENWNRMDYATRRTAYQQWDTLQKGTGGTGTPGAGTGTGTGTGVTDPDAIYKWPGTGEMLTYEGYMLKMLDQLQAGNIAKEKELKDAADAYTKELADIDDEIAKRKNNLLVDKNEIRDNPWITQGAVDRRIAMAEENAKGDLDLLIAKRNSATESYNTKVAAMQATWERQRAAVGDYTTLIGNIEQMKAAEKNAEAAVIKAEAEAQHQLQTDARQVVNDVITNFGSDGLKYITSDILAATGYTSPMLQGLSSLFTQKDLDRLDTQRKELNNLNGIQTYSLARRTGDKELEKIALEMMQYENGTKNGGSKTVTTPLGDLKLKDISDLTGLEPELVDILNTDSLWRTAYRYGTSITKNPKTGEWERNDLIFPQNMGNTLDSRVAALKRTGGWRVTPVESATVLFNGWKDDKGVEIGHMGIIEHVNADGSIVVEEANEKTGEPTTKTYRANDSRIVGYWAPPGLKDWFGFYPQLDMMFEDAWALKMQKENQGDRVLREEFLNDFFKNYKIERAPEYEGYIANKLDETMSFLELLPKGKYKEYLAQFAAKRTGGILNTVVKMHPFGPLSFSQTKIPTEIKAMLYQRFKRDFYVYGDLTEQELAWVYDATLSETDRRKAIQLVPELGGKTVLKMSDIPADKWALIWPNKTGSTLDLNLEKIKAPE